MRSNSAPERVWYASYGSNMSRRRFLHYLQGGCPASAARVYEGARDACLPTGDRALTVPGGIRFGWESRVWGGGIAFHDPQARGRTLVRAYLITVQQLSDVVAQEMHREVGEDLDLSRVLARKRDVLGPGRYETLHLVGECEGAPVLTFTASDPSAMPLNAPRPVYVQMLAQGLREAHRLGDAGLVDYLLACPGMLPTWDRTRLAALLADPAEVPAA